MVAEIGGAEASLLLTSSDGKDMFKGLAGMASMMGHLHQVPGKLEAINARLRDERVVAQAAEGRVTVEMNGLGELQGIKIDPRLMADGDMGPAEQSICDATNEATVMAKRRYGQAIHEMAQELNLNIPGIELLLTRLTGG